MTEKTKIAFLELAALKGAIHAVKRVFSHPSIKFAVVADPLFEAGVTKILIELKDALQILRSHGMRLTFKDDIPSGDITDLIATCRNAACHIASPDQNIGGSRFRFFSLGPNTPNAIFANGVQMGNIYHDDFAVGWGPNMVYFKRHLERALIEAESKIQILESTL